MKKRCFAFAVAFLLPLGAVAALAQMGTGRVSGTLKDPQGKPIVGGTVSATSPETERALETTTDKDGKWALLGFRSGTYEFSFSADGFVAAAYKNSVKQMGRNPSMDVVLEPLKMGQSSGGAGGVLDEANKLFEAKDYQGAITKYEELLAAQPTLYQVNYNIGSAYREMGDLDKAITYFQKVLDQEANNNAALVSMGDALVQQGKLDEAVPFFEKAIDQTTDEVIPFNVAEIYFNQGNTEKALQYYQLASERKPDWPEPHMKLAMVYLNMGNFDSARQSLQKVIEMAPDSQSGQMAQQMLGSLPK